MDTLALTDRDGTYGAVRFAKACHAGRDPAGARRRPRRRRPVWPPWPGPAVRAAGRDAAPAPRSGVAPSATAAAPGHLPGRRRPGWAALCRLVSATHLAGERGDPVSTLDLVAEHCRPAGGDVLVLLGPGLRARPGGDAAPRRPGPGGARAAGARWSTRADLLVEVVSHRLPGVRARAPAARRPDGRGRPVEPGCRRRAHQRGPLRRPARRPDRRRARRRPPAGRRSTCATSTGRNAEGFLKSGKQMAEVAEEICRFAGLGAPTREARRLLARTRAVADRCALDPRADLGLGEVHFPEFEVAGRSGGRGPRAPAAADGACCGPAARRASAGATAPRPGSGSGSGSTTSSE